MKAKFLLLRYLMTCVRPIALMMWLGLVLLLIAAGCAVFGDRTSAMGYAIYAYVPLLVFPYLFAWHAFRTVLCGRRLALLPGFRLQLCLALLLLTALLALYLPLASWLFYPGMVPLRTALAIFLGATLFSFTMQWVVTSPYSLFIYSLGPFVLLFIVAKVWPVVFIMFYREENVAAWTLVSLLAWCLVLRVILTRRNFQPPRKAPLNVRDYIWDGRTDLLGVLTGNYKGQVKTAEGTLLLGAPDGLVGRFYLMLNMVLLSPLVGMLGLYVVGMNDESGKLGGFATLFLTFSLTTALIYGQGNGDHALRYRLLWLRLGGDRRAYWRRLERRVFANVGLLALIVVPIAGVILMLFETTFDPLTYCAVALTGNLLANYFSLAARLSQWSTFLQLLIAGVTVAGLALGRIVGVLPLPVLLALILGLALLFRQQAMQGFRAVDWQQWRPALQTIRRKTA